MKSRKFKAVLAAVSAIAVLATAMTGFAATLNTTTTYNFANNKVAVETKVTGVANGTQVTYLVKTAAGGGVGGQEIAYIDQQTASDGATFNWQIDREVLSDALEAEVIVGNDEENNPTVTGDLGVSAVNDIPGNGYTINYTEEYAGAGDSVVNGTVVLDEGKEIVAIKLDGTVIDDTGAVTFTVAPADAARVTVEVKDSYVTPDYVEVGDQPDAKEVDGAYETPTIFKATGSWTEAGVKYEIDGEVYEFEALEGLEQDYIIVVLRDKVAIDHDLITPYVK